MGKISVFPLPRCHSGVRESTPVAVTYNTHDIRLDNGREQPMGVQVLDAEL